MATKIQGTVIGQYNGLTIRGRIQKAKRAGKDRIWIHIRQEGTGKPYRVAASLSYVHAVDVRFEGN
jgi:hypothetical protein